MHDVTPISGYLTFYDGPSSTQASLIISSTEDQEEEANDVFSVKLTSVKGGGRVSDTNDAAILTGTDNKHSHLATSLGSMFEKGTRLVLFEDY